MDPTNEGETEENKESAANVSATDSVAEQDEIDTNQNEYDDAELSEYDEDLGSGKPGPKEIAYRRWTKVRHAYCRTAEDKMDDIFTKYSLAKIQAKSVGAEALLDTAGEAIDTMDMIIAELLEALEKKEVIRRRGEEAVVGQFESVLEAERHHVQTYMQRVLQCMANCVDQTPELVRKCTARHEESLRALENAHLQLFGADGEIEHRGELQLQMLQKAARQTLEGHLKEMRKKRKWELWVKSLRGSSRSKAKGPDA